MSPFPFPGKFSGFAFEVTRKNECNSSMSKKSRRITIKEKGTKSLFNSKYQIDKDLTHDLNTEEREETDKK